MSVDNNLRSPEDINFTASAATIPFFYEDNKPAGIVLGLRREDGCISPIGGRMERWEEPLVTAVREWREETGTNFTDTLSLRWPFPVNVSSAMENKTSLGYVFFADLKRNISDKTSEELQKLLYLKFSDLAHLVVWRTHNGHKLFRPDLNIRTLTAVHDTYCNPKDKILTAVMLYENATCRQKLLNESGLL